MFVFSILSFILLSIYAMNLSGDISVFIDLPAIFIVSLTSVLFMFASTSINDVKVAFLTILNHHANQNVKIKTKRVFSILGNSGILVGSFMTLIALIAVAAATNEMFAFGLALSLSMLPFYYGLALKIICYVAEQRTQILLDT